MHCPSCGASNEDDAAACAICARALPPPPRFDHSARVSANRRGARWPAWAIGIGAFAAVALVAHAARIIVPAYRAFAVRVQVAEGLALAEPFKNAVRSEWQARRAFAEMRSGEIAEGLERRSAHVEDVAVVSGAVVVTFGDDAQPGLRRRTLTIVPALDATGNLIDWQCGRGPAPPGFEAIFDQPARLTDIPEEYLPAGCRQE